MKKGFCLILFTLAYLCLAAPGQVFAGTWVVDSVSNQFGSRNYKIWVPSSYNGNSSVPLVMMLHGCTQSADDFAAGTQMNAVAESNNFLVVYPEQPSNANQSRCWNWFESANQSRGSGEPSLLVAIVNKIKTSYNIDNARVYAAGLSAGAAMSVILGATYPDVFSAIAVSAGLEYKAATSLNNSFTALSQGGPNPNQQGTLAFQAMGSAARKVRVIVFHGSRDFTVNTVNGNQVISQWAQTNDLADDGSDNNNITDTPASTVSGTVTGGYNFTTFKYNDPNGATLMEKWIVENMGHAWSGGSTAGSFVDPKGPKASNEIWRFFSQQQNPPPPPPPVNDVTPPVLTISPAGGSFDTSVTVNLSLNEAGTIFYTTDGSDPTNSNNASRRNITNNGSIIIQNTSVLTAYGVDLANNVSVVQSYNYVVNPAPMTNTFVSVGGQDGYVATTSTTATTGSYAVSLDIYAGDNADMPLRGVVSFDTSSIPDGATILSAELRLFYTQASLGNPWVSNGALVADISNGCLGGNCALAASDFQATVSASNAIVFPAPTSNSAGTSVVGMVNSTAFNHINKTGNTQFKLRFQNNSNNNKTSDYLLLAGGEYFLSQYRPVLVVQYK
ncbi:MAG: PHB depolymerase family esterase [Blastocatellia bacterium]|nr:PHB depolymerase family esterase [Blastocatellia bacterium]MBL8193872.1 PHB depolymerase family esterase [Blastocatellia bacterium]MBN8725253.1 PHB depolymerase family esterase [Acidobacteriota bacterium]